MHSYSTIILALSLLLVSCKSVVPQQNNATLIDSDCHVHIMSPQLISTFKDLNIPFGKADAYYSNIDTILSINGAKKTDLIGMAYVYGNPEFYYGEKELELVQNENNFLFEKAKSHPQSLTPFFAIDPLKEYAIQELRRCHALQENHGIKLHFSSSQVYLTEPVHLKKVKKIFQWVAEMKAPLLIHFDNWHPKFGAPDIQLLADSILQSCPAMEIRIAHFGTSGGFNEKTKRILDEFILQFEKENIPDRHKILFDISAVALNKDSEGVDKLDEGAFKELNSYIHKIGLNKIIFGTDYPLYDAKTYINILKNEVGLSQTELDQFYKSPE